MIYNLGRIAVKLLFVLGLFFIHFVMMVSKEQKVSVLDRSCDAETASESIPQHKSGGEEDKAECDTYTRSTALAVVPYDGNNIVQQFFRTERQFVFEVEKKRHEITIHQNWKELGVAAVVWDAAVVLCEFLAQNVHLVYGKRTIELGAGTGLVGIFVKLLGAEVTVTDRKLALESIKENVRLNIDEAELSRRNLNPIIIRELSWGENLSNFPQTFDIVLGADIVYVEDTFTDLISTIEHLSNLETVTLIAARIRYERDSKFFTQLRSTFAIDTMHYDSIRNVTIYSVKKLG